MKAYDLVTHDGKRVDRITHEALLEAEDRLGYELTIMQGSYNTSVGASAGTHDGGGAVDLAPFDWQRKVKVLREVGFAAWYRAPLPGVWSAHIHALLIGNERLAPVAARQVTAYYSGRDGLAGNGPDPHTRPNPVPIFRWQPERSTRGGNIDAAIRHLRRADASEGSPRAEAIKTAKRALRALPQKTTTRPFKDKRHTSEPKRDRGYEVNSALLHIRRALRVNLVGKRRKALVAARDALRGIEVT